MKAPKSTFWYLIENNSMKMLKFASEAKLKVYAKEKGYSIKKSRTDDRCYYTSSYQYIPARQ